MILLSASLIFMYAVGAIISPLIAGWIIEQFGAPMMFTFISMAHFILMAYTIYRNFARPVVAFTRRYAYIPRTSLYIATIIKGRHKRNDTQHLQD